MRMILLSLVVLAVVCAPLPTSAIRSARISSNLTILIGLTDSGSPASAADTAPVGVKPSSVPLALDASNTAWLPLAAPPNYEPAGLNLPVGCPGCTIAPGYGSALQIGPLAGAGFDGGRGFSVEAWVRPDSAASTGIIVDSALPGTNVAATCTATGFEASFRAFSLAQSGDTFVFTVGDVVASVSACRQCTSAAGSVTAGSLYHLVGVMSADMSPSTMELYVNGVGVGCSDSGNVGSSFSAIWGSMWPLALGGKVSGGLFWPGNVYLMALYTVELSSAQVAVNTAAGEYNHVPVAVSRTAEVAEDTPTLLQLNATDPYDTAFTFTVATFSGNGALFQVVEGPSPTQGPAIAVGGTVVTSALGRVWYVPPAQAHGPALDTITFTADDSEAVSLPGTVTVDVLAVDDQPTVTAGVSGVAYIGAPVAIPGLSVADNDGETVRTVVQASSGLLSLTLSPGVVCAVGTCVSDTALMIEGSAADITTALSTLTYSTLLLESGVDTVVVRVNDPSGGPWNEASVTVTVTTTC